MISLDQNVPYQHAPTSTAGYIPEQAYRFFPSGRRYWFFLFFTNSALIYENSSRSKDARRHS